METNRLQAAAPAPKEPPCRLPIVVTFVGREKGGDETAKEIREFCHESNLMFETRAYDSFRYRQDRDEVLRLPALHIAVNGRWMRTFYPNTRPLQHIQEVVHEYQARLEAKRAKRGRLGRQLRAFMGRVKAWFHRETAMERHEREEATRRASMTTAAGDAAGANDWERRFAQHRRSSTMADWE